MKSLSNLQCQKNTRRTRQRLFPKLEKNSHSAEKEAFNSQNYFFFKPKSVMEVRGRYLSTKGVFSEKVTHSRENRRSFPQSLKNSVPRDQKINREVTHKTRETIFVYSKPQKTKNCKKFFEFFSRNFFFQKSYFLR